MLVELDEKVVQISERFTIAYGGWGKRVTTAQILDRIGTSLTDKEKAPILNSGFIARYHPNSCVPFVRHKQKISADMVEVATRLSKAALAANNWNGADLLFLATSTPPDEGGVWGEETARKLGIDPRSVLYSFQACNSATAALLDVLKRDDLKNARVLITSVEPLAHSVNPRNWTDLAIFGNGAAAMAFSPKNLTLISGKTVVTHDKEGVISIPKSYDLPPVEERTKIPGWVKFEEGGEVVFTYTDHGTYMVLPEPKSDGGKYLEMDGIDTVKYFKKVVPPVLLELLEDYRKEYGREKSVDQCISHQPSKTAHHHVIRESQKLLARAGLPTIQSNWVGEKIGMSNSSSATPLFALAEELPKVPPKNRFMIVGFGVGSSTTAMIVSLNN